MDGSRKSLADDAQKSLPVRQLSVRLTVMRRYRAVPAVVFAIVVSALVGGFFGRSALAVDDKTPDYKTFAPRSTRSRRTTSAPSNPTASSTARSAACSARSIRIRASSIRKPTRRCASVRKAATTASASRFRALPTATSSRPASSKGRPAYKKGVRRGDAFARIGERGRQGLDHRTGDAEAARPEGDDGEHLPAGAAVTNS